MCVSVCAVVCVRSCACVCACIAWRAAGGCDAREKGLRAPPSQPRLLSPSASLSVGALSVTCVGRSRRARPSPGASTPDRHTGPCPGQTVRQARTVGCPSLTNLTLHVLINTTVCLRSIAGRSHDALQARLLIRTWICTSTRGLSWLVDLVTELSARGTLIGHVCFWPCMAMPAPVCAGLSSAMAPPLIPHATRRQPRRLFAYGREQQAGAALCVACFGDAGVGAHVLAMPGRCRRAHVRTSGVRN